MLLPAVPPVVLLHKEHIGASTLRAGDTPRPSPRDKVFAAIDRIGEVENGFLKCGRFHVSRVTSLIYFVKYIISLILHSSARSNPALSRAKLPKFCSFRSLLCSAFRSAQIRRHSIYLLRPKPIPGNGCASTGSINSPGRKSRSRLKGMTAAGPRHLYLYGDLFAYQARHPESNCADEHGNACDRKTTGLLYRRHVRIGEIFAIGKELSKLEEVDAGLRRGGLFLAAIPRASLPVSGHRCFLPDAHLGRSLWRRVKKFRPLHQFLCNWKGTLSLGSILQPLPCLTLLAHLTRLSGRVSS